MRLQNNFVRNPEYTMRRIVLFAILVLTLFPLLTAGVNEPVALPLSRILATPHAYSGKMVTFDAYLDTDRESSALYSNDHPDSIYRGVWFDNSSFVKRLAETKLDFTSGWVRVVGRFECATEDPKDKSGAMTAQKGFGQLGMWQMRMMDVSSFVRLPRPARRETFRGK